MAPLKQQWLIVKKCHCERIWHIFFIKNDYGRLHRLLDVKIAIVFFGKLKVLNFTSVFNRSYAAFPTNRLWCHRST